MPWAFEMVWTEGRNLGRLFATAIGVGFCFLVLLVVVTIPSALASMEDRRAALAPVGHAGVVSTFSFLGSSMDLGGGQVVHGFWLDGASTAPLPPGVETFPERGQLWVSPELDELLQRESSTGLVLPGEIVGVIDRDVLPNPYDLWFYGGTDLRENPSATFGDEWGDPFAGAVYSEFDPAYWSILVTGTTVLLIPLFLVVALASRFGSARRDRRSALLRLLGARRSQLRLLVVIEAAVATTAGLLVGAVLFLLVRALSPLVQMGWFGLQSWDLTPPLVPALLVGLGVVLTSILVAVLGARQAAMGPLGMASGTTRRPHALWRLGLVAVTVGTCIVLLNTGPPRLFGSLSTPELVARIGLILILGLVSISALVGLLSDLGARSSLWLSPAGRLAARRITADGSVATRSAAAMATVLAGALILVGVFEDTDRPNEGFLTLHGAAELNRADAQLHDILGSDLRYISALVGSGTTGNEKVILQLTMCGEIAQDHPGTPCTDGDVFRVTSRGIALPPPPFEVTTTNALGENTVSWSPPAELIVLPDSEYDLGGVYYLLTPKAFTSLNPAALDQVRTQVSFSADEATRQRLIEEMQWLGPRLGGLLERHNRLLFGVDVLPWLKVGILLAGALTLLAAGFAQVLTANEHLRQRRRAYALARATGVPLSTLRRSVVVSALWPSLVGVVVAVLAAAVLAPVLQAARLRTALPFNVGWALGGAAVVLLSTLLIALVSAARLDKLTGPDALRTE